MQPLRRCVGCRQMLEKSGLIRISAQQTGEISIDHGGKKQGRGAYICANADCIEKAKKNKGIERSLKRPIPPEIYNNLIASG